MYLFVRVMLRMNLFGYLIVEYFVQIMLHYLKLFKLLCWKESLVETRMKILGNAMPGV